LWAVDDANNAKKEVRNGISDVSARNPGMRVYMSLRDELPVVWNGAPLSSSVFSMTAMFASVIACVIIPICKRN
jgi:hypothetical protein